VRIVAPLPPLQKRPDKFDFLTEFYDINNQIAETIAFSKDNIFQGENQVLYGDNNVLSGSQYIGNAIGTGIESAGYNSGYIRSVGYEGFISASQGLGWSGFMM